MTAPLDAFLTALVRDSFAGAVLALVVLGAQWIFRRQLAPRWRCALWLLVAARLLPLGLTSELSVFNLLAESRLVSREPVSLRELVIEPLGTASNWSSTDSAASRGPAQVPGAQASAAEPSPAVSWNLSTSLFVVWLVGALTLAAHVALTCVSLNRRLRGLRAVDDPGLRTLLQECCVRMRVRRPPPILESDDVSSPALHGCFRPRLLLPRGFRANFSTEELRFVLLHELAHLRRSDLPINWVMTALQIVHWFNPLVWFAFARWRGDRELACDAAALVAAGVENNTAYGRTMLKLLDTVVAPLRRPGLVGILESKRALRRRLTMIARFSPERRPLLAIFLLPLLAAVGLTNAQIMPAAGPSSAEPVPPEKPVAPFVLYLINGAETMLGETDSEIAAQRTLPEQERRLAPKWQRTAQLVERSLAALPPEKNFHVAVYFERSIESLGGRRGPRDTTAAARVLQRLRELTPRGGHNLGAAFEFAALELQPPPEKIVLITDGLPTTDRAGLATAPTEKQRIEFFEVAMRLVPPRVPVHTVLLPLLPGDPAAGGLYWELAHASRGGLSVPARTELPPRTHLAFIVDTSGSMRDPNSGGLWPIVIDSIDATLAANPQLTGVQLLDGDGRFILGRRAATGAGAWLANTAETGDAIRRALLRYSQDTVSNPVPGVKNALRFLRDKHDADMRMGIMLLGDEFNSREPATVALEQLAAVNTPDASGRRPIVIDAIGFPTTIRYQFSMGNTGLRFADLMRRIAHEHGGTFIGLPEL